MSYQVLAQKYRPQTFDDVIGQEAATRTLKNSVLNGRTANAYIFAGPRGVGKTTVARLLAKALNCEKPEKANPCNKCDSCRGITEGSNIDVLEIDGASNNGVDEVRALRENARFSPSKGKFKIYIIDEVHMLSTGAFNALLKTLEEPPKHVKFIFATTEPHRVIPTIMSRCQRFDFKRISPKMIRDRLLLIVKKEKIAINDDAAFFIARTADGSLRDALVILDQMVSFASGEINLNDVMELLGTARKDNIFELAGAIINNDAKKAAEMLDEMIASGKDPVVIANALLAHYRDLMIIKTTGSPALDMAFTEEDMAKIKTQLEKLSIEEIIYILQNISHAITLMKQTTFSRSPLEIAVIRLTKREAALSLPALLEEFKKRGNTSSVPGEPVRPNEISSTDAAETPSTVEERYPGRTLNPEQPAPGDSNGEEGLTADYSSGRFNWKAVLNYVRNKKMSVYTFLNVARALEFNETKIVIGFGKAHAFNKEALETAANKSIIEEAINKVTGASPKIEFTLLEFLDKPKGKNDGYDLSERKTARENMKPIIQDALDVFGGHIVRDVAEDEKA